MPGWISDKQTNLAQVSLPPQATAALPPKARVETIMLFGLPKCGKSSGACSLIEEVLTKNQDCTIHYVCTDDGLDDTFNWYFQNRSDEIRSKMKVYYPSRFKLSSEPFFNQIASMFYNIRDQAKKTDWIIVDLAGKFWNWAQDVYVEQTSPQNVITTYLSDAAKDMKRFSEMNRLQWQFIKRLDNIATFDIIENPPCNLLYIFGENELDIDDTVEDQQKENANDIFRLVGCKPEGQKKMAYAFSTIVYLGGLQQRSYIVLGDRGYMSNYKEIPYERSWYKEFLKNRGKSQ